MSEALAPRSAGAGELMLLYFPLGGRRILGFGASEGGVQTAEIHLTDAVPVAAQLPAAPQRPPLPAGRVLSVVRSGASREAAPAATDAADAARERVLAVPVRVQADNRGDTAAQ